MFPASLTLAQLLRAKPTVSFSCAQSFASWCLWAASQQGPICFLRGAWAPLEFGTGPLLGREARTAYRHSWEALQFSMSDLLGASRRSKQRVVLSAALQLAGCSFFGGESTFTKMRSKTNFRWSGRADRVSVPFTASSTAGRSSSRWETK